MTRAAPRVAADSVPSAPPPVPRPRLQPARPLHLLHFSNSLARGGAEEHWLGLLRGLDRARFRLHLVCAPALARALGDDVPNDVRRAELELRRPSQTAAAWRLAQLFRRWRIDLVHSHLFYSSLFATPIAWACGVPVRVETPHLREHWRRGWKDQYWLDRRVHALVDGVIAVSRANARYLLATKRLRAERVAVIPNGVDLAPFARPPAAAEARARLELALAPGAPVLIVIGRLEPQKDHAALLATVPRLRARLPGLQVFFVGEGALRAPLLRQVAEMGLAQCVHLVGFQSNVPLWLAAADVVALPSRFEGLPLAAIEALAAERAVVATMVDGTPEVIQHERTGLGVPAGNAAALGDAILRLLLAPDLRRRLAAAGREHALANFDRRWQIEKTEQFYLDLWRRKTRAPLDSTAREVGPAPAPVAPSEAARAG